MSKEDNFCGRSKDLALLEDKWNSRQFELGLLYGARRIGKTTLVNKFLENKDSLYFQSKEASELENRRGLSRIINKRLGMPADYVYPAWDELFEAVLKLAGDSRFAFVIDEYPYLSKSTRKGVASYLQDFIDNKAKSSKLFILLMGSNVSFMENEVNNKKSPLYRRRTFTYKLRPMAFSEALLFLKGFDDRQKFDCLSFFGFSPYYLALLDSKRSFKDNLKSLLFSQGSTLLDAPDIILSNGTRDRRIYNTVLLSIARGKRTPTEISADMEISTNELSKYLKVLCDEEIIEKRAMFNSVRKVVYAITDPMLEFFYQHLSDDAERIRIGFGDVVFQEKKDAVHDFICRHFENVCLHYMEEQSLNGKLPAPYYPIQNLVIDNSELGRSVEIDGLSRYKDSLLVIECKYTEAKRSLKDFYDMKEDVSIKMFSQIKRKDFYLFSKSGFDKKLSALKEKDLHLIDIQKMLVS